MEHPHVREMPVTGTRHKIVLSEQDAPRTFEVRCLACHNPFPHERCVAGCHRVTWTPWGEAHAKEIAALHLFYMDHPDAPRLHHRVPANVNERYR